MNAGRLGPVNLETCLTCGGVWFLARGLQKVLGAGSKPLWRLVEGIRAARQRGITSERTPRCPSCGLDLEPETLAEAGGVSICTCPVCEGQWTETETLAKAATALAAQEAPPTPVPEARPGRPAYEEQAASRPPQEAAAPWGRNPTPPVGEACPHCGQRNPRHSPLCNGCGKLLQGDPMGSCPQCESTLLRIDSQSVEFGACSGCGGVWIEDGQLSALLMQSGLHQDQALLAIRKAKTTRPWASHPRLHCIKCRLLMFEAPVGMMNSKPAATCPQCQALFLDHELISDLLLGK